MDLLRIMTAGSVDDGKSTLIGKLFHDYGSIPSDNLESIARNGLNLAHFTDGLKEEREKGITIDVAYKYLETPFRKFIIADCPGHQEFTRNMVTASTASDFVLILVDASRGVTTQTWRHTAIVSWLGKKAVYLLNKMDSMGYSETVYESFRNKLPQFPMIPISALQGDNVLHASKNMAWYKDPTLDEMIHSFKIGSTEQKNIFFVVQSSVESDALGFLSSGTIRTGMMLKNREGETIEIKKINRGFNEVSEGRPGEPLRLSLTKKVKRGEVLCSSSVTVSVGRDWNIEWCQLVSGSSRLVLRHHTEEIKIKEIKATEALDLEKGTWERFSGEPLPNHIYRGVVTLEENLLFTHGKEAAIFNLETGATVGAVILKEKFI
ncbi:MAG: GTP-binding protein [Bacteriovoracaceae bacterium]